MCIRDSYQFDRPHLKETPGYEFHSLMYDRLTAPGGMERMCDQYIGLQSWGSPEQVYDKVKAISAVTGADAFVAVFRFGGMAAADAERSMRLFAREVMPELKRLVPAIQAR